MRDVIRLTGIATIIATAGLLLSGCGGATTDPGPAPVSHLHQYAPGDQWVYSYSGTEYIAGLNLAISGTETREVSAATVNNQSVLAITITDSIEVNNQHLLEQTISYVKQDPTTGDLKLVADTQGPGGALRTVTAQQIIQQGTFEAGSTKSATLTFDSGETQTSSETVQAHQFVNVPAGTFNTWRTLNSKSDTNGVKSNDIEWWAPEIGQFVKADVTGTEPGFNIHFVLTLTSTTVTTTPAPAADGSMV